MVVLSTRDAQRALRQSTADATDAIDKNGKGLSINTQKGRDNAAALDTVAKNAIALGTATYASTHSEAAMRASLVESRASLVATAVKFGMTKSQAEHYADQVLRIPPAKKTTVTAVTAAAAAGIANVANKLAGLHDPAPIHLRYYVTTSGHAPTNSSGSVIPGVFRAAGGPVMAGMPYVVGDGGRPELFVPDTNGTILPRVPTAGGGGRGGGGDIHIHVNGQVYGTTKDLGRVVLNGLQQLKGSGVQLGLT